MQKYKQTRCWIFMNYLFSFSIKSKRAKKEYFFLNIFWHINISRICRSKNQKVLKVQNRLFHQMTSFLRKIFFYGEPVNLSSTYIRGSYKFLKNCLKKSFFNSRFSTSTNNSQRGCLLIFAWIKWICQISSPEYKEWITFLKFIMKYIQTFSYRKRYTYKLKLHMNKNWKQAMLKNT